MAIIKFNPYSKLSNEDLIDFTLEEIDKLKYLSQGASLEDYDKSKLRVNLLIKEIKKRDLSLKTNQLRKRILL